MLRPGAGILILLVVAVAAGYYLGSRQTVRLSTGRADVAADGSGSISADDWTYGYGPGIEWTDALGTWHESGQPDCLPPGASVEDVRFAWTEASIEGFGWRPVVWIDCQSVQTSLDAP